jgi:hypothetical protein
VASDFTAWLPTLKQSVRKPWLEPTWPWVMSGVGGAIAGFAIDRTSVVAMAYPYYVILSVLITGLVLIVRNEIQHVTKPQTEATESQGEIPVAVGQVA